MQRCKLKSLPHSGEGFFCALLGKRLGSTNGREGDKIISDEHGIGGTEFSNLIVWLCSEKYFIKEEPRMRYYFFKTKKTIFIKIATAFISIIGIASMPYVVKLLFDYDFL